VRVYTVLVSGSRHMPLSRMALIYAELMQVLEEHQDDQIEVFRLIQGGARGADALAAIVGKSLGYEVETEGADWKLGKPGGKERNQVMLAKWKPDQAFFFHHSRLLGTGTLDMYRRCVKAGVPTKIVLYPKA
jgi:hypothetical protein